MKTNILSVTTIVLLAACASAPKPVIPSGRGRTPINSAAAIEDFKARTAEEQANYIERTALSRQVEALEHQVAEMKAYVAMLATREEPSRPKVQPVSRTMERTPATPIDPTAKSERGDTESIEVRERSVLFRVSHPFAETAFDASEDLRRRLVQTAAESRLVEIRGRTDALTDNAIDRDIAMLRAVRVRRFLLDNGIEASKIRLSYLASGDHIADNSTPNGRARNRRVEIEAIQGLSASAYPAESKADGDLP